MKFVSRIAFTISLVIFLVSGSLCQNKPTDENKYKLVDLSEFFSGYEGSFILYDLRKDEYLLYNQAICKTRYSPCSTFKIPNSLIAFETGIASDTSFVIPYDSLKNPAQPWMRSTEPYKYWMKDNSINLAFRYSSVWYYQEIARRVGQERMQNFINSFEYGNEDISGGIDKFWLCGTLKISAVEQIEFLTKLYRNQLTGISEKSLKLLKDIMLAESNNKFKLYAKTGGGNCDGKDFIGWYIGFIETGNDTFFFALNMFSDSFESIFKKRINITLSILKSLKIMEEPEK